MEYPTRSDPALSKALERQRFQGFAGGHIQQHRAMAMEPHSGTRTIGNVLLTAFFLAVWGLSLNLATSLWAVILEFWRQVFGWTGYAVLLVDYPLNISVPYLYVTAGLPGRNLWIAGAVLTLVLVGCTFLLPAKFLPVSYLIRIVAFFQACAQVFFLLWPEAFPYTASGYVHGMLLAGVVLVTLVPLVLGLAFYIFDFTVWQKAGLTGLVMAHFIAFIPLQYMAQAFVVHNLSLLFLPLMFFVFGLPLNVLVFIGFYGWGASWETRGHAEDASAAPIAPPGDVMAPESRHVGPTIRTAGLTCLTLMFCGALHPTVAQQRSDDGPTTSTPWAKTIVLRSGFGRLDDGNSASQSMTVYLTKPDHGWIFSLGHRSLIGSEGFGGGVSYAHIIRDGLKAGAGVSTGENFEGGLYPRYQIGVWLRQRLFPGFRLTGSYTHREAARVEVDSDRFGSSFIWYVPGPFILQGHGTYTIGHPGNTKSWGGGGSLTFERYRRLYVGFNVTYGDGSYLQLSTQDIIEFAGWSYGGRVTKYVNRDFTLSLSAGHSYYYGGGSLTLALGRSW